MILIFDHMVSVIIAGVVILMLVAFQSSVYQTSLGRTILYAAKKQTLELADNIEKDLANAGYETPPGETGIISHSDATVHGVDITENFEFWTELGGTRTRVKYELAYVDSVNLDGVSTPLFELVRSENTGGGWVAAGGSAPVLVEFKIGLRTDKNQPTTDLSAVRSMRIRLAQAVVPSIEQRSFLRGMRRLRWGIQLRPPNLQTFAGE